MEHRVRVLERRFRDDPGREVEVCLVQERLRLGFIDLPRLELAAYCGSEAAASLLGRGLPTVDPPLERQIERLEALREQLDPETQAVEARSLRRVLEKLRRQLPYAEPRARDMTRWLRHLVGRWGEPVAMRALLAAMEHARREHLREHPRVRWPAVERVRAAIRRQVLCPCHAHREALRALSLRNRYEGLALTRAAHVFLSASRQGERWGAPEVSRAAWALHIASGASDATRMQAFIARELIAWALAHGDPVKAREGAVPKAIRKG